MCVCVWGGAITIRHGDVWGREGSGLCMEGGCTIETVPMRLLTGTGTEVPFSRIR